MTKKKKSILIRGSIIIFTLLMQLAVWAIIIYLLGDYSGILFAILMVLSMFCIIYILAQDTHPETKIPWIIIMFLFPLIGGFIYVAFRRPTVSRRKRKVYNQIATKLHEALGTIEESGMELFDDDYNALRQSKYLSNVAHAPAHTNTEVRYYALGEEVFESMLDELRTAEKFIFLEYFMIEEGHMWGEIEKILIEKAAKGVDVRVLIDDLGCVLVLPPDFAQRLSNYNIDCRVFNPFNHLFNSNFNNRDHRKICVIDGNIAFTGGINLTDAYINLKNKYGHWKDTGVMLKGEAVYNLTVMFLSMWSSVTEQVEDFSKYAPTKSYQSDGIIQPFGDAPLDEDFVAETLFMNMINRASKYVYITTPYLIISRGMLTALVSSAQSGVDVRIILPAVADKSVIHFLSRSYYEILIKAGVKIFEYSPGFIHSKTIVCDDKNAVAGTINFDYRSFNLHYECAVWFYKSSVVSAIKKDILNTQELCKEISMDNFEHKGTFGIIKVVFLAFLRAFAPVM